MSQQIIHLPFPNITHGCVEIGPLIPYDGIAVILDKQWMTILEGEFIRLPLTTLIRASHSKLKERIKLAQHFIETEHGYANHNIVVMQDEGDYWDVVLVAHKSCSLWGNESSKNRGPADTVPHD